MDGWINGEGGREEGKKGNKGENHLYTGSWGDQKKLEKRDGILT